MKGIRRNPWLCVVLLAVFFLVSCGGAGGGGGGVQLPDIDTDEVLNAYLQFAIEGITPSEHTQEENPIEIEADELAFSIKKQAGVTYTVRFQEQNQQVKDETEEVFRYEIDLTNTPGGTHPITFRAALSMPARAHQRSSVEVEIWIKIPKTFAAPTIQLQEPQDQTTGVKPKAPPTLRWQAQAGQQTNVQSRSAPVLTKYEIFLDTNENPVTKVHEITNLATQQWLITTSLNYGTTYYWKVIAHQSDGQTTTSEIRRFTTEAAEYAAPTIVLLEPEDEVEEVRPATPPTLRWQAQAGQQTNVQPRSAPVLTKYEIFLDTNENPVTKTHEITDPTTQQWQVETELNYGTTYYWKVVVHQSDEQSTESEVWSFSTKTQLFMLTLQTDPEEGGTVSGEGSYPADTEITITATPNEGYQFVNWTQDGTEISQEAEHTYTMPAENVTLVANFEEDVLLLRDIGNEGPLDQADNVFNIIDNTEFTGLWRVDIRITRLPEDLRDKDSWTLTVMGETFVFVENRFDEDVYGINIPDALTDNADDIREGIFEGISQ